VRGRHFSIFSQFDFEQDKLNVTAHRWQQRADHALNALDGCEALICRDMGMTAFEVAGSQPHLSHGSSAAEEARVPNVRFPVAIASQTANFGLPPKYLSGRVKHVRNSKSECELKSSHANNDIRVPSFILSGAPFHRAGFEPSGQCPSLVENDPKQTFMLMSLAINRAAGLAMSESDKVFAGSIPEDYDRYMVPLILEPFAADLAQRAAAFSPSAVLETAAGSGVVTRALAPRLPPGAATDHATSSIADRHGSGEVAAKIQAHVIVAVA
jgi:hypothetical protein